MILSYHCLLFGLLHYRAVPGLQTPLSLLIAISFCNRDTLPMIYLTKLQKTSTKRPHLSLSYFSQFLSLKSNQKSVNSGADVTFLKWWDLGNIFFRYWLMIHSFHCSQIVLSCYCISGTTTELGVLNKIFIGMKITKHFVFRTVVSERSYGKIREAPKTWNLHKYLKTAENLKNFISKTLRPSEFFFMKYPLISTLAPPCYDPVHFSPTSIKVYLQSSLIPIVSSSERRNWHQNLLSFCKRNFLTKFFWDRHKGL